MFDIFDRLRTAAARGGFMAIAGVLALIGVLWVTAAAYTLLAAYLQPAAAMLVVGAALLAPLAIGLLRARGRFRAPPEPDPAAQTFHAGEHDALSRLAVTAQSLTDKSPLAGAVLALGAAWLASRSPATQPLAIQIIAEAVDQWAKSGVFDHRPPPDDAGL